MYYTFPTMVCSALDAKTGASDFTNRFPRDLSSCLLSSRRSFRKTTSVFAPTAKSKSLPCSRVSLSGLTSQPILCLAFSVQAHWPPGSDMDTSSHSPVVIREVWMTIDGMGSMVDIIVTSIFCADVCMKNINCQCSLHELYITILH